MPPMNPPVNNQTIKATSRPGSFDFGSFQKSLDEQNRLREARQAEQVAVAQKAGEIKQQSADLANRQFQDMGFLKRDADMMQAKASHARQLADSNNPVDTLRLLGLQAMDPNGYLSEQRDKRLQSDRQVAATLQQYYAFGQDALQAKLTASTAQLDVLTQLENIGNEKLTSFATSAKLMHDNLTAQQQMKEDSIHAMDIPDLTLAIGQAKASPNGMTNIGGIDVDLRTLEDRQQALKDRLYDMTVKDTARQLAEDENAHVGDTIAARNYDRAIIKDKVAHLSDDLAAAATQRALAADETKNLPATLADRDYNRALQAEQRKNLPLDQSIRQGQRLATAKALIDQAQEREVRGMSQRELNDIRNNNYKNAAGEQYQPSVIDDAYARRKQAEVDSINEQVRNYQLDNFDTATLAQERERTAAVAARVPAGTPLEKATKNFQSAVGIAGLGAGKDQGIVSRASSLAIYSDARAKYDAAIDAQAKFDAKGDKNLEEIRRAYYRGEAVPQETLTNAAADRLGKFKSVADLFPAATATKIERRYRDLLQARLQVGIADPAMSAEDKKIVQADVVQEAIDWGINQDLKGQTEFILGNQIKDPSHPLYGKMSQQQLAGLYAQADGMGIQQWKQINKLSDADADSLMNGIPPQGQDTNGAAQLYQQLKFMQNQELLQVLDGVEPGLGHDVATWWQANGSHYIQQVQGSYAAATQNNFQANNFGTISQDVVGRGFDDYAVGLSQADATYQDQMTKRNAEFMTFNSDPQKMQAAVLSHMKDVTDPERSQLMTEVIQPLLDAAKQKGLDFASTNEFVEKQIASYEPKTPEMKSLMKTMRRVRPDTIANIQSWSLLQRGLSPYSSAGARGYPSQNPPLSPALNWYNEWRLNRGETSMVPAPVIPQRVTPPRNAAPQPFETSRSRGMPDITGPRNPPPARPKDTSGVELKIGTPDFSWSNIFNF